MNFQSSQAYTKPCQKSFLEIPTVRLLYSANFVLRSYLANKIAETSQCTRIIS